MSEIFRTSTIPYTLCNASIVTEFANHIRSNEEVMRPAALAEIQDVVLSQSPNETLNLKVYFVKDRSEQNDRYQLYRVFSSVIFKNELHEFSQSYVYEVLCERSQGEKEPVERLFTLFLKRIGTKCVAREKSCLTAELLSKETLSFCIRRHNLDFCKIEVEKCIDYQWLRQEVPADVKLSVNGETIILAHKFLLKRKSEVFKAMFTNKMTETETGVVHIEDFSVNVIKEMVNFMYTNRVSDIKEMCCELYGAADKYQLHDLCRCCIEYILFNSKFDNIIKTLELACSYNIKELENRALTYVEKHPEEMSKEPSYQEYMCRTMVIDNVVDRLIFARLYNMKEVSKKAFDFIGQNFCEMKNNSKFNELFQSDPLLMKEIVHYFCEKYAGKVFN